MSNPLNNTTLVGRPSQDLHEFPQNADGSVTIAMTLAVDDNYVSGPDRKVKTNFISTRIFVPASVRAQGGNGSWDRVHKGDLIAVSARLSQKPYTDRNGETVYPNAPTVEIEGFPQFLESKQTVDARAARAMAAQPAQPAAAAAPQDDAAAAHIAQLEAQIAAARAGQPAQGYSTDSPFGA